MYISVLALVWIQIVRLSVKFKIQKGVPVSENRAEFGVAKVVFRKKYAMLLSVLLCFSSHFPLVFMMCILVKATLFVLTVSLRVFLFVENFVPEGKLSVYYLGII